MKLEKKEIELILALLRQAPMVGVEACRVSVTLYDKLAAEKAEMEERDDDYEDS